MACVLISCELNNRQQHSQQQTQQVTAPKNMGDKLQQEGWLEIGYVQAYEENYIQHENNQSLMTIQEWDAHQANKFFIYYHDEAKHYIAIRRGTKVDGRRYSVTKGDYKKGKMTFNGRISYNEEMYYFNF